MAYEPKAKKGDLSKKLRQVIATGLLAVAAVGTAAPAQAGWLDDLKKSDTVDSIVGTVIKNAGGQIQNIGTDKANKLKCETVDNGIWQQSSSAGGGYSTDGKKYSGGAAGRTSGKCLTGSQKTRYLQKILREDVKAAQATMDTKAQENKTICQMAVTDRQQQKAICTPLARDGRTVGKKLRSATSIEGIAAMESKFVQASDNLQQCMSEGKAPIKCYMDYNKQKM